MDSHNIVSRCPSCGGCFLFIGKGGHLTCSLIGCDEPVFDRAVDNLRAEVERLRTREKELLKLPSIYAAEDWLAEIARLREALEEIRAGKGAYNQDPLKHCTNTVEDIKRIADKALKDST